MQLRNRRSNQGPPSTRAGRWLAAIALLAGCGGGGDAPTGGGTPPPVTTSSSIVVLLSAPSLTLAPGASQTLVVTIARTGSFTGAVSLAAAPLPAGVTVAFQSATIAAGATTTTMTVTAAASAGAVSNAIITITGTGSGVSNASAGLALTISAPPASTALFTITPSVTSFLSPSAATLTHQPTIAITRNAGYTGAITFTVSGLPATVAAGVTPATTTASGATLLIVNAGAPNGTYTMNIRAVGAGSGGERTASVQVVVAPTSTGSIVWRLCSSTPRYPAYFVAVRDGSGPYTRVVPGDNGTSYAFNISQGTGSVAWVALDSGVARTTVFNGTAQELSALAASDCLLYNNVSTRTATGSATGMSSSEFALVGMGWWSGSVTGPTGSYLLQNLPTGTLDLFAARGSTDLTGQTTTNRMVLRRGLNPASGASNAVVDFNAAEAFAPLPSRWIVGNTNGEAFSISQYFHTAGGTSGPLHAIPQLEIAATSRNVFGVPVTQSVAGDLHQTILTIGSLGQRGPTRQVITYARTLSDRLIDFGPALPTPSVTAVFSPTAGLLRAQGTVPIEYASGVSMDVKSTGALPRFATVHSTRAFLGAGTAYDIAMPDLTQVLGWDTNWNIRRGDATQWWVSGGGPTLDLFDARYIFATTRRRWNGANTGIVAPTDGLTILMARASGTITP